MKIRPLTYIIILLLLTGCNSAQSDDKQLTLHKKINTNDKMSSMCASFHLTQADVVAYFKKAKQVDEGKFHYEGMITPCSYGGKIKIKGISYNWEIYAGGAGTLYTKSNKDRKRFLCEDSCYAAKKDKSTVGIFNKSLALSYQQYEITWQKIRPKLLFENNKVATNCPSYIQLKSNARLQETLSNMQTAREYLSCEALKILKTSKPMTGSNKLSANKIAQLIVSKLDLRSFKSSLYQQSNQEKQTIKSLFAKLSVINDNTISIKINDWSYKLEVVANVLINDNNKPDWILWLYDEALQGNYRSYQTLLILDPDENGIIKASDIN